MDHASESSEGVAQDHLTRRLRQIERRWKTAQIDLSSRRWWQNWKRADSSFLVGATLAVVLLPLDAAVLGFHDLPFFDTLGLIPTSVSWIGAIVVISGNALIIDTLVTWRTPDHLAIRGWVKALRLLSGGIPLLGLHTINVWQWMLGRRPSWAFGETGGKLVVPPGPLRRAAAQILARRPAAAAVAILWLYGGSFLLLLVWTTQLSSPGSGLDAFVVRVVLHVLVGCCLVDCLRDELRKNLVGRWIRAFLWTLPPLSLLFPLGGVAGLLGYQTTREKTLCAKAYFNPGGARRLAPWAHLQHVLDQGGGILRNRLPAEGPETTGRAGRQLANLCRLKTFLLGLDTLALGWLLGRNPGTVLTVCTLAGAGAAILLAGWRTLVRSLHPQRPSRLDAHAYGGLLALGLVFAVTGWYVGSWLRLGSAQQAGLLVMYLIALGMMFAAFAILLRPWLRKLDLHREPHYGAAVVGFVLFFALMILGGLMAVDAERAETCSTILVAAALLTPAWHGILAAVFQGWLLHPFSLEGLLDGRYPRWQSWRLAFLLTTLALPLGGLAVPGWILLRHRWPSHDPFLGEK